MSLRARIGLIAAAAVAVSVLATSWGIYLATARTLHSGVDQALAELAEQLLLRPARGVRPGPRPGPLGGPGGFVQVLGPDGAVLGASGLTTLPVIDRARQVAMGGTGAFFATVDVGGVPVRMLTVPTRRGAVQVARPVAEIEQSLAHLRRQLSLGAAGAVLLAAALGTVVARRAVQPVHELTELAEEVAATQDLSRRIAADRDDELGRLARTFNTMLANLEQARVAQEQLVADASHELRTPLTSLRTNVEVLAQADRLDDAGRRALIGDVVAQLDEFGRLVTGLVELARGERPLQAATPVRLDELVGHSVDSARTFHPSADLRLRAEPSTVLAEADRLERAVANLLDNALKHGRGPVEVNVRDGVVTVRDHGPGIAPEHLPHVFDRFYRAPEARGEPGSGLGLSIVRQVARAHGGDATVANTPGGGVCFTLALPPLTG